MAKKPVKAGTSKSAAADRRKRFVDAYLCNGRNGTQAAITAGFARKGAEVTASKLLREPNIAEVVREAVEKASISSGLTVERTLQEVARLAYFDPRKLLGKDGAILAPEDWDDDTAAGVASLEVSEEFEGQGPDRRSAGLLKKIKLWDKNAALEKAMKHLGLYEKDNSQRGPDLALQINLLGPA